MAEKENQEEYNQDEQLPEVEQELSQVATNPKQSMMILAGIICVFIYLFFNLFISSDSGKEDAPTPVAPEEISKPVAESIDDGIPDIPTLPTPPKLEEPTPPEPPAMPVAEESATPPPPLPALPGSDLSSAGGPAAPELPFSNNTNDAEIDKRLEAKRKSSIFLVAGTPPSKTPEEIQEENDFSYRGDMSRILGRGKMLDAVIETAINSDFDGEIRAVIQRDIYSAQGKNILIPKGARVFGNYASGINGAYGRIDVEWTRVDLANGYTLNLSGTGTDALGRKGYQGRVDDKFEKRLSNAVLRSALNITLARGLDKFVTPQTNTQAAATQRTEAENIQNVANSTFTQTGLNDNQKRTQICANVLSAITDKTSSTYLQINSKCNELNTNSSQTDNQKLTSLMSSITSASNLLISTASNSTIETQAQAASKEAYTEISDTIKTLVEEQELKPTITVEQGTSVKIYVNRDYQFPKAAISLRRAR